MSSNLEYIEWLYIQYKLRAAFKHLTPTQTAWVHLLEQCCSTAGSSYPAKQKVAGKTWHTHSASSHLSGKCLKSCRACFTTKASQQLWPSADGRLKWKAWHWASLWGAGVERTPWTVPNALAAREQLVEWEWEYLKVRPAAQANTFWFPVHLSMALIQCCIFPMPNLCSSFESSVTWMDSGWPSMKGGD